MPASSETFVVIGGGQAGAWIARTLRTEGFDGRVVLIGEEAHWPYERPPLSKAFLQGAADAESMTLLGAAQAEAARIECWRGTRVVAIDRAERRTRCMDGREIGYDKMFLATGGRVRTLPGLEGSRSDRIYTLRTQSDALRLRAALTAGSSLLVLGGGWIGLEVAATARGMGCAVTVLEAAPRLCARTMPETVSDFLLRLHQSQGVTVRTGIGVTGLSEKENGVVATVDTGELLRADHALIGIGIVPDTTLAVACGLPVANGIVVDAQGRTADPNIFAAGDVACRHSDFAGAALRLESWANAQNQAIVAAKAALGRADRYDEIPWFWSDQYTINLQMLGLPDRGSEIVTRGTPEAGNGCWLMLREDGTAAGAVAVNAPRELRTLRKTFADGRLPVLSAWADTAVPLQRVPTAPVVASRWPRLSTTGTGPIPAETNGTGTNQPEWRNEMAESLMKTQEIRRLLDKVAGFGLPAGDERLKNIVHRVASDVYRIVEEFDVTPTEFWSVVSYMTRLGQANEVGLLVPGGLGIEHFLDLVMDEKERRAGLQGGTPRTIEGPLYIAGAPLSDGEARLDQDPEQGEVLFMEGRVKGADGNPIAGAIVDVWHANTKGGYSHFDPSQSAYNLRRRIATDAEGRYRFRSILPAGYGCPPDGPTQLLLTALGRHGRRPAHIHFFVEAPGHRKLTTQINIADDEYLYDDFAFATRDGLIPEVIHHTDAAEIKTRGLNEPFASIRFDFTLNRDAADLPEAAVEREHAKAT